MISFQESFHQNSEMNETIQSESDDWRKEETDDLLLRAVEEYQAYLRNQKKAMQN